MILEFEEKIMLAKEEKRSMRRSLREVIVSYNDSPEEIDVYLDRFMDNLSETLKAREWNPEATPRRHPDDKGDNSSGSVNVTVDYEGG